MQKRHFSLLCSSRQRAKPSALKKDYSKSKLKKAIGKRRQHYVPDCGKLFGKTETITVLLQRKPL
ncbi:MAG TPA: hypothetical protein DEB43_01205 [Desulfovibrio sp.]|nr:hypothetical protein [Desulfovibrio sp.]